MPRPVARCVTPLPAAVFASMAIIVCSSALARSQSLDVQERCASLARTTFEELEREAKANQSKLLGENSSGASYQSHYNVKLHRCFMFVSKSEVFSEVGIASHTWFLIDAVERRFLGAYTEGKVIDSERAKRTGQRNSLVPTCELTPTFGQKSLCKTREEFDAFVAGYMDE